MSPFRDRWVSTAIEALEAAAHKDRGITLGQLVQKYGVMATDDVVRCDRYRYTLRSLIMRAWKKRRKLTSVVVNELPCYAESDIVEIDGLIDLGEVKCCPKDECVLAAELKAHPDLLETMKKTVDAQPAKDENTKRSRVLRDLLRLPKQKLTQQQCRHLGDAIFAYFCPVDATLLTTNERDLRPLAEALGKNIETP